MKKKNIFKWANPDKKFMVYDLEPNEIFSEEYAYYALDVSNFNFEKIDARRVLFDKTVIKRFLDENKIRINVDDFITIFNLQSYIHMMWPDHAKSRPYREEIFAQNHRGKNNPMLLSDAFKKQIAACVECCLLAQLYLQHCGIESKICCGNAFFEQNPKIEMGGSAHAYLVIKLNDKQYIYDPSNPMLDSKKSPTIPRIMDYSKVPFKDRMAFKDLLNATVADGGGFAYIEASDIYGLGTTWLYGFESDDNSLYSKASRQRTAKGIKRQTPNQQAPQQIYGQGGHRY